MSYLGHIIGKDGVWPNPSKLKSVENFPQPDSQTKIRELLGLTGYYRKFIKNFPEITKPLTRLLQKDVKYDWTDKTENAFQYLKKCLTKAPILQYPIFDQPSIVTCVAYPLSHYLKSIFLHFFLFYLFTDYKM